MKHKTKRALLLAKKYGLIVLCIAIDFFVGVGIYHSVTWISDKCHKDEPYETVYEVAGGCCHGC